jgi:uncharacterized protein with PIN domain
MDTPCQWTCGHDFDQRIVLAGDQMRCGDCNAPLIDLSEDEFSPDEEQMADLDTCGCPKHAILCMVACKHQDVQPFAVPALCAKCGAPLLVESEAPEGDGYRIESEELCSCWRCTPDLVEDGAK